MKLHTVCCRVISKEATDYSLFNSQFLEQILPQTDKLNITVPLSLKLLGTLNSHINQGTKEKKLKKWQEERRDKDKSVT